jgi:hypothetical protein
MGSSLPLSDTWGRCSDGDSVPHAENAVSASALMTTATRISLTFVSLIKAVANPLFITLARADRSAFPKGGMAIPLNEEGGMEAQPVHF